jgi:beta-lactamase class D
MLKPMSLALSVLLWGLGAAAAQQAGKRAECFIVSRPGGPGPLVSDARECARKSSPASTFKIPHALVALETGAVTPEAVVGWDGTPYDFESWRRDHTLDSAIKASVYPFFQRTAGGIGRERLRQGLAKIGYGPGTFEGNLGSFWIDGSFVVSPMEQFSFVQRMFGGDLPVQPRHLAIVERALEMPAGQILNASGVHPFALDWPAATVVRAKTGFTTVNGERVSWLVGELELEDAEYVFVARARSRDPLESTAGAEVASRGLNTLRRR